MFSGMDQEIWELVSMHDHSNVTLGVKYTSQFGHLTI